MPKQVRLRRGTSAQHAAFTGAEGEVTYDTNKKILVVHDGVTAGGIPQEGYVKLTPGNPMSQQTIASCVRITGGDADVYGFSVQAPASFQNVAVSGTCEVTSLVVGQETLAYAPTVQLDFATSGTKRLALAGNIAFASYRLGFGRELLVKITGDGSARTITFPVGWRFVGGAAPATIQAGKTALLRLWSFGTTDADVLAHYLVEG